jgi:aquaporin Z
LSIHRILDIPTTAEIPGPSTGRGPPAKKSFGLPKNPANAIIQPHLGFSGEAGTMTRKLVAEFIGTFMLVSSVCGAALFSLPSAGLMTVAFAIGTAVLAMAYAVGPISGAHFNPAVTCGLAAAGRFRAADVIPYIIVQVIGGIVAAAIFYFILSGAPAGRWNDFIAISNIYGGEGHFPVAQVALIEIILTALFVIVIVGVTSAKAAAGFAPLAIGLTLTFIHLVAIPVDNASVNPARSTATAIFGGSVALSSLWLFWVAPIVGGVIGGLIGRWLQEE